MTGIVAAERGPVPRRDASPARRRRRHGGAPYVVYLVPSAALFAAVIVAPFGMNIFVAQSVLGLELKAIYKGIIPFLVIYLIALVLITYIPEISLGGMRLLLGL